MVPFVAFRSVGKQMYHEGRYDADYVIANKAKQSNRPETR